MTNVFRQAPATVQHMGDHWIIVGERSGGEVLVVNDTGRAIFQLCDGRTLDQISQQLATTTGADNGAIRADVEAFTTRLANAGLVTVT